MIPKYTLGFLFNKDLTKVLLIHRQKPIWQKGKINGLGGKFENQELNQDCISREVFEEANILIEPKKWIKFAELHSSKFSVEVLTASYLGLEKDAISKEKQSVEWFMINDLPKNVITNLTWLIPLAIEKLKEGELNLVIATYNF